jgi:hypothetical protein
MCTLLKVQKKSVSNLVFKKLVNLLGVCKYMYIVESIFSPRRFGIRYMARTSNVNSARDEMNVCKLSLSSSVVLFDVVLWVFFNIIIISSSISYSYYQFILVSEVFLKDFV